MKFEVMSIKSEKKKNGNSRIELRSMEDESIIFSIAVPSKLLNDTKEMKAEASWTYAKVMARKEADKEYKVKVGTIL